MASLLHHPGRVIPSFFILAIRVVRFRPNFAAAPLAVISPGKIFNWYEAVVHERGWSMLVLVVDDEGIIADTLTLISKHSGFEALAAYSGEAAIQTLITLKPDLLITDLKMVSFSAYKN